MQCARTMSTWTLLYGHWLCLMVSANIAAVCSFIRTPYLWHRRENALMMAMGSHASEAFMYKMAFRKLILLFGIINVLCLTWFISSLGTLFRYHSTLPICFTRFGNASCSNPFWATAGVAQAICCNWAQPSVSPRWPWPEFFAGPAAINFA